MPSSIFNSDSLRTVRPRVPLTAALALAVVLGLEALVAALPNTWKRGDAGALDRIDTVERMLLAKYERPRVVLLGSSRAVFGVAPRVLDDALGLPPLSCVNASIIGGGPELMELLYERNRERLRQAELVLINVDEWHFNDHTGGATTTAAAAPSTVSAATPSLREQVKTRCVAFRTSLAMLRYAALEELGINDKPAFDVVVDENNQMWFTDGTPPHTRQDQFEAVVRDYYRGFHIAPQLVEPLRRLIARIEADGPRVVLMQMPNRPAHQAAVERLAAAEYREQVRKLEAIAAESDVPFWNFDEPSACGLSDADWADGVHLTPAGALKFTRFLGEEIARRRALAYGAPLSVTAR